MELSCGTALGENWEETDFSSWDEESHRCCVQPSSITSAFIFLSPSVFWGFTSLTPALTTQSEKLFTSSSTFSKSFYVSVVRLFKGQTCIFLNLNLPKRSERVTPIYSIKSHFSIESIFFCFEEIREQFCSTQCASNMT